MAVEAEVEDEPEEADAAEAADAAAEAAGERARISTPREGVTAGRRAGSSTASRPARTRGTK